MNKEQQIEEMAKIINELYCVYTTTETNIAEGIYQAGYRKIDENCAVITKDELKLYQKQAVKEFANILYKAIFKKPIIETGEKCIVPINGLIDSITFNNLLEKLLNEEYEDYEE